MCIDTGTKTPKIETQTEAKKKKTHPSTLTSLFQHTTVFLICSEINKFSFQLHTLLGYKLTHTQKKIRF